jgi:hypothetical protein
MQSPLFAMARLPASHMFNRVLLIIVFPTLAYRMPDTMDDARPLHWPLCPHCVKTSLRSPFSAASYLATANRVFLTSNSTIGVEATWSGFEYKQLGQGFCVNQIGDHPHEINSNTRPSDVDMGNCQSQFPWSCVSDVDAGGNSLACAERCTLLPQCTGYVVNHSGWCGVIAEEGFYPSGNDQTALYSCFSKHRFKYNTSVTRGNVPKIIWTYWSDTAPSQSWNFRDLVRRVINGFRSLFALGNYDRPSIIELSQESWRLLNPEHELRMVTDDSLFQWIDKSDLPPKFDAMLAPHRADSVRLATVAKYGGVWIDASSIMLRPLSDILGKDGERQVFFTTDRLDHHGDARYERRIVPRSSYSENSFFAAPANDPFITRTNECFHNLLSELQPDGQARDLDISGSFSARQLEELKVSKIGPGGYLSMMACFYKTLDEDVGLMRHWQESPSVQQFNAMKGLFPHLCWGEDWSERLLKRVDAEIVETMTTEPERLLIKFRTEDREHISDSSEEQLRCRNSTLRELLVPAGLALPVCT